MSADVAPAAVAGLLAGWGIALPVGAVGVLLVLLGARHGRRVGCAGGMGAAVVDGVYATAAVVLGSALAPVLVRAAGPVRWASAAVLVGVALLLLRPAVGDASGARAASRGAVDGAADGTVDGGDVTGRAMTPRRAFLLVLAATAVNPATVVYFVALTSGASATTLTAPAQRVVFVLAAFAASASWQLLLGSAGAWAGARLTGTRGRRWTAVVGAVVVLALAVRTALGA